MVLSRVSSWFRCCGCWNDGGSLIVAVVWNVGAGVAEFVARLRQAYLGVMVAFAVGMVVLARLLVAFGDDFRGDFAQCWYPRFLLPACLAATEFSVDSNRNEQLVVFGRELLIDAKRITHRELFKGFRRQFCQTVTIVLAIANGDVGHGDSLALYPSARHRHTCDSIRD